MGNWTPGPWRIVIDGTCSGAWPHIVAPDFGGDECYAGDAIAELGTCFVERRTSGMPGSYSEKPKRFRKTRDHDQVMANARLITAAPELLAFADRVFRTFHDAKHAGSVESSLRDDAKALIAAATGEQA